MSQKKLHGAAAASHLKALGHKHHPTAKKPTAPVVHVHIHTPKASPKKKG